MPKLAQVSAWLLAPVMLVAMIAVTGQINLLGDFRAFYCAGDAIAQGANPYLEEPLHSCEQRAHPPARPSFLPLVTLPAPLPPGILVAFVPLSRLPFAVAGGIFGALSLVAMVAAVLLFSRATGVSSVLLNLAFGAITATQTYFLGQPEAFVFLALAAAAVLVQRRFWIAAAACATAASIEPHIALPVLIAMLLALPRTRLPIACFCALLALIGVAGVGLTTSIAYVLDVIPAHALANAYEWQFSLTSVLTSAGVGALPAVRWGEAMYAVMVALGIAVACRMLRATGDRAVIVLLPPAFAVFGGVHIHFTQIAVAFPALLLVSQRYPRVRSLAASAVVLVMIPWNVLSASVMTGFTPLLVGSFARATMGTRRGLVFTAGAAAIAVSVLVLAKTGFGPGETHFVAHAHAPGALAESSWGDFSRAMLSRPSLLLQWLRIPVLTGLALGVAAMTWAAFAPAETPAAQARAA